MRSAFLSLALLAGCASPLPTPYATRESCPACGIGSAEDLQRRAEKPAPVPPPRMVQVLPATPAEIRAYQDAVADGLRDPDSAQFRRVRVVKAEDGGKALCGELNAKNAYGGYVGYDAFYSDLVIVDQRRLAVTAPATMFASKVGVNSISDLCVGAPNGNYIVPINRGPATRDRPSYDF